MRMAQRLRGSEPQAPSAEFLDRLYARLFHNPPGISRRSVILSALGAVAAGLAAGVSFGRPRGPATDSAKSIIPVDLVGAQGTWYHVAEVSSFPPGAVRAFTAGAVQGYLMNHQGRFYALTSICPHMGCVLSFDRRGQAFVCPCHEARFDLHGRFEHGQAQSYLAVHVNPKPQLYGLTAVIKVFMPIW
ncbi:MAG TPA: Rieske (2Fe-2S) protein [Chloroflexota bacterium]